MQVLCGLQGLFLLFNCQTSVKSLATIGGAIVFLIFMLMIVSAVRTFFGKRDEEG